jgi:pimeloyl-ACP methyl ester carboxylesterase
MATAALPHGLSVRTARGAVCGLRTAGPPDGPPLIWFHGATGLLDDDRCFEALGTAGYRVLAPELPGYGSSTGEELLEDMLDFTLHGWDVVDALECTHPILAGHSMGGMIAAEMAALCPERPAGLVLVAPNGLWDDAHPVPDLFSLLPFQFPEVLFADPVAGAALMTSGEDFDDPAALTEFVIANSRRLGTAGKILFPLPERRLAKRLYRVTTPTLLIWGDADRYVLPWYAPLWSAALTRAASVSLESLPGVGHMAPHEAPVELAATVTSWLGRRGPAGRRP